MYFHLGHEHLNNFSGGGKKEDLANCTCACLSTIHYDTTLRSATAPGRMLYIIIIILNYVNRVFFFFLLFGWTVYTLTCAMRTPWNLDYIISVLLLQFIIMQNMYVRTHVHVFLTSVYNIFRFLARHRYTPPRHVCVWYFTF